MRIPQKINPSPIIEAIVEIRMERIYRFAVTLLQDTEDIPEEFAKVLNDDFWEII
jgi:hypothetical protein